jgi:hypothetical protein
MGDEIVEVIRELGARADLTVEPGRPAHAMSSTPGPVPDQFRAPRTPYQPDPADYLSAMPQSSSDGLWILPLASVDPDAALPPWRRLGRRVRHRGRPRHRPLLLWSPWPSELLWDLVEADVDAGQLSVLPFIVRADTLLNPAWSERFESHLLALAEHPFGRRVELTTPSVAVSRLSKARA